METILKYTIIFSMVYVTSSFNETHYIHQLVNGSLDESWNFNFTVFFKEFKGIVLYCYDWKNNTFDIKVQKESNNDKSIRFTYNRMPMQMTLKHLCGCDTCNQKMLKFRIKLLNNILSVSCNGNNSEDMHTVGHKDYYINGAPNKFVYAIRKSMTTVNGTTRIIIGNFIISQQKQQSRACLQTFYFGEKPLTFNIVGSEILPTCLQKCNKNNDYCNGGLCQKTILEAPVCDCVNTALNGKYCNRSLQVYNREANNSYQMPKGSNNFIKITWMPKRPKVYCLIDFVGRYKNVTLSIYTNHLILNSDMIFDSDVNFANVKITPDHLVISKNKKHVNISFQQKECIRINIGFSEHCETFEGSYDVHFSWFHIISTPYMNNSTISVPTNKSVTPHINLSIQVTIGIISLGFTILVLVLVIVGYVLINKNNNAEEVIDIGNIVDAGDLDNDYSTVRVQDMYMTNMNTLEDVNGYILPSHKKVIETPPSPPAR